MPGSSPASVSPCPIEATTLDLPSDRMNDVEVLLGATVDVVRFGFGPPTTQANGPAPGPSVRIAAAAPPFVADPSGLPLDVTGERVAAVRMQGMWLYDDAGIGTYGGPPRFDEPGPGLRSVVLAEAFEGYETWLIGFDGPGCLTVAATGGTLEIRIAHPCGC